MGDTNNSTGAWAVAVAALVLGGAYFAFGGGGKTQPAQPNRGAKPRALDTSDDSWPSDDHSSRDDDEPTPRDDPAKREAEQRAQAERDKLREEADEARAKREESERLAETLAAERAEKEKAAQATKESLEQVERQLQQADASEKSAQKLDEQVTKTEKAMQQAESARKGTIRAGAEAVIGTAGGSAASIVIAEVGRAEAIKDTYQAHKKGESVAEPMTSYGLNTASKVATIAKATPVVGNVITAVQLGIAVKKDIDSGIESDKAVDQLAEQAKSSDNPQIVAIAQQHEKAKEEVVAEREKQMAEPPLFPDDDYQIVKPLLDASNASKALDRQLASNVKDSAKEQAERAASEKADLERQAQALRAEQEQLTLEAEQAKEKEAAAQAEALKAKEAEQAKLDALNDAEKEPESGSEQPKTSEPASSGGGLWSILSGFLSSAKREADEESTKPEEQSSFGDQHTSEVSSWETPSDPEPKQETPEPQTPVSVEVQVDSTPAKEDATPTETPTSPTETTEETSEDRFAAAERNMEREALAGNAW